MTKQVTRTNKHQCVGLKYKHQSVASRTMPKRIQQHSSRISSKGNSLMHPEIHEFSVIFVLLSALSDADSVVWTKLSTIFFPIT